jgi:hypothetical protein
MDLSSNQTKKGIFQSVGQSLAPHIPVKYVEIMKVTASDCTACVEIAFHMPLCRNVPSDHISRLHLF